MEIFCFSVYHGETKVESGAAEKTVLFLFLFLLVVTSFLFISLFHFI